MVGVNNRSLAKRVMWITSCASVASFWLIGFDDWKTNNFRVFIEVLALREYYAERISPWMIGELFELIPTAGEIFKKPVMLWRIKDLEPHSCYYLGQYPWHWDYEMCAPRPPGPGMIAWEMPAEIRKLYDEAPKETWTGPHIGPYTGTPGVPGVEGVTLKNLSEEEFIFYHGKLKYANYLAQQSFTEWLNTRLKKCIAANWPPTEWKPKIKTPYGDWPGKPFTELDIPTPTVPHVKLPRLMMSMGLYFSRYDRPDGLTLDLEIR